jgi:hypothetical protein
VTQPVVATEGCLAVDRAHNLLTVVRVDLVNGRRWWLLEVVEDDDRWLRGTNSRGRSVLLMRDRVKQLEPN